jgi:hypothetical protein
VTGCWPGTNVIEVDEKIRVIQCQQNRYSCALRVRAHCRVFSRHLRRGAVVRLCNVHLVRDSQELWIAVCSRRCQSFLRLHVQGVHVCVCACVCVGNLRSWSCQWLYSCVLIASLNVSGCIVVC